MTVYLAIIALTILIYLLDVTPSHRRICASAPASESDDADEVFLDNVDEAVLIAIANMMIEGRSREARFLFEQWLDDTLPEWRKNR